MNNDLVPPVISIPLEPESISPIKPDYQPSILAKIWRVFYLSIITLGIISLSYYLLLNPMRARGENLPEVFKVDSYIFSERISFLLREPRAGDAVIFKTPEKNHFGIIVSIKDISNIKTYQVISTTSQQTPWEITRDKILSHIYFPSVRGLDLSMTPLSSPAPVATSDPTAGWNNYHNDILSFRYDSEYTVKEMSVLNKNPEFSLSLERDDLNIAVFNIYRKNSVYKTNDSPAHDLTVGQWISWNLYNNCEDKSFGVLSGKYCTSSPYSEKEYIFIAKYDGRFIEIVGKGNNQLIIDQTLSTFKFTNDLDQNALYTCPQNGWVNCMPILSAEGQRGCSDDAITWYKRNCSNFEGIAQ